MLIPTPNFDFQKEPTRHLCAGLVFFLLLVFLFSWGALVPFLPAPAVQEPDYSLVPSQSLDLVKRADERARELQRSSRKTESFSFFHYCALLSAAGFILYPVSPIIQELRSRRHSE